MKNIQQLKIIVLIFGLLLATLFLKQSAKADVKTMDNDYVYQILEKYGTYEKAHSVMSRQHERLSLIFSSFLMGDTRTINRTADELDKDMNKLVQTHLPNDDNKIVVWKSIAEITEETAKMKKHVSNEEYDEAYASFTNITISCIRCHQVARKWGKFPEIKPLPTKAKTTTAN